MDNRNVGKIANLAFYSDIPTGTIVRTVKLLRAIKNSPSQTMSRTELYRFNMPKALLDRILEPLLKERYLIEFEEPSETLKRKDGSPCILKYYKRGF